MNSYEEKSRSFFNKNATRFKKPRKTQMMMYEEIIKRMQSKNPSKILDIGCGTGNALKEIHEHYDRKNMKIETFGLDISEEMIKIAKKKLKGKSILEIGNCERLPWKDNAFDLVICNASFHHYPHPEKSLKEIRRVLKENGTLIIGDYTAPSPLRKIINLIIKYSNTGECRRYNQKEIEELLIEGGFIPKNFKLLKSNVYFIEGQL